MKPALCIVGFLMCAAVASAADEPIRIGMFASLTGREAAFGQLNQRGAMFAIEELNARGGVLGRRVELLAEDTRSLPGEAATAVKKLVSRDKVVAMVGGTSSSPALEAAPLCQSARIPLVAATSTNPRVTEVGDYIFRACFIDPFQGEVLAKFARHTLGARRVAILFTPGNAYSVGLVRYFREKFVAEGGEVAVQQRYVEGDRDFRAQLTAIRAAKPDAIFAAGNYTEGALAGAQARQLGLQMPLFGGDTWDTPAFAEIGGKGVEGAYFSGHFSADSTDPAVRGFVERFRRRWGEPPDTGTSLGYDAVMLLADAMRRAGSVDGPAVRDALAATRNFAGVTGSITIDAQRNASKSAVIFQLRQGKGVFVTSVAP